MNLSQTIETLVPYLMRIAPGLAIGAIFLILLPRKSTMARLSIYILLFILMRDALTPEGLWALGRNDFFWIRLHTDALFLIIFGLSSGLIVFFIHKFESDLSQGIHWFRKGPVSGIFAGLLGAALTYSPFLYFYSEIPVENRGGPVAFNLVFPILIFAFFGNLFEEYIFRGQLQTLVKQSFGSAESIIISALAFSFCHVFLAYTVTDLGFPILAFTLWEGLIAAIIAHHFGVIPAAISHGGAIFLLATALL